MQRGYFNARAAPPLERFRPESAHHDRDIRQFVASVSRESSFCLWKYTGFSDAFPNRKHFVALPIRPRVTVTAATERHDEAHDTSCIGARRRRHRRLLQRACTDL